MVDQLNNLVIGNQVWPLNIVFHSIGTLKPQADITPLESVQLVMMLVCAQAGSAIDFPGFAKENGLERHFTK